MRDQIAGDQNFFLGEINHSVSRSVAAAQEFDLDFAVAKIHGKTVLKGQRSALELDVLKLCDDLWLNDQRGQKPSSLDPVPKIAVVVKMRVQHKPDGLVRPLSDFGNVLPGGRRQ